MLFIEDSYLKDFDATILNIDSNKIILDRTAFYAKSGGQPGDIGKITLNGKEMNIIDTVYDNKQNIIHVCENSNDLKIDEKIKGKMNIYLIYPYTQFNDV